MWISGATSLFIYFFFNALFHQFRSPQQLQLCCLQPMRPWLSFNIYFLMNLFGTCPIAESTNECGAHFTCFLCLRFTGYAFCKFLQALSKALGTYQVLSKMVFKDTGMINLAHLSPTSGNTHKAYQMAYPENQAPSPPPTPSFPLG